MPLHRELGNDLWELLHASATIAYEKGGLDNEYTLFEKALIVLMPCDQCREHYHKYTQKNAYISLGDDYPAKLNYLHNRVNDALKKKIKMTREESIARYRPTVNNPTRYKEVLSRVALTYARHWNQPWGKKQYLNKIKHIRRIVQHGMTFIGVNNQTPKVRSKWKQDDYYTYHNIYAALDSQGFTKGIKRGFSHRTKGCNCKNK